MGQITWNSVSRNWSVLFTAAVALWFLVSAINIPEIEVRNPFESSETASASASPVTVGSTTSVEVRSFHIDSGPPVMAELTLQVGNQSDARTTFRPDSLELRRVGGQSSSPIAATTPPVEVAAGRSVIVPVSFPARLSTAGNYELTYVGNTVFTGRPLAL